MKNFALVDCNNFYVSCERLFKPRLQHRPVVVLSNNDGCIIARSEEAKALGITMGEPFYKVESFLKKHGVKVFSSNYALYGDLSYRVMDVLQQLEPEVEVYSIDEAFVVLPEIKGCSLKDYGSYIRQQIKQYVGLPVSIGIGPTKTLAKLANKVAKKEKRYDGVFDIAEYESVNALLAKFSTNDIWGIGRRYTEKLQRYGINDALGLKNANDDWLRKNLTVVGLRTAMELRGTSCLAVEDVSAARKSIVSSRSFGTPVARLEELKEAVASYVTIATEKLRSQNLTASSLHVFLLTNRFKKSQPQYSASQTVRLGSPTANTSILISQAIGCLEQIYKSGYQYQKTGVMLTELTSADSQQMSLFGGDVERPELMQALDRVNARWGRNTLQYAAAGIEKKWSMKQQYKSQAFTTRWDELPVVQASFPD